MQGPAPGLLSGNCFRFRIRFPGSKGPWIGIPAVKACGFRVIQGSAVRALMVQSSSSRISRVSGL